METANLTQPLKPAFSLLKVSMAVVPIVAGLDKFTNLLTHWENYIQPNLSLISPFTSHEFMILVGIVEIIAGIIVLAKPSTGVYVISIWLTLIAFTLISSGNFLDVAVRDLVMAMVAFSLVRMVKIVS